MSLSKVFNGTGLLVLVFLLMAFFYPGTKNADAGLMDWVAGTALSLYEVTLVDETMSVPEDQLIGWDIDVKEGDLWTFDLELVSGPKVDLWWVDDATWKKSDNAEKETGKWAPPEKFFKEEVLASKISTGRISLPKGKVHFRVDNSDFGQSQPPMNLSDDVATVKVLIKRFRPSGDKK